MYAYYKISDLEKLERELIINTKKFNILFLFFTIIFCLLVVLIIEFKALRYDLT